MRMSLKGFCLRRFVSSLLIAICMWANGSVAFAVETSAQEIPLNLDAKIVGQTYCA